MIRTLIKKYFFILVVIGIGLGCRQSYRQHSMVETNPDKIATTQQSFQYVNELIEETGGSPELYFKKARLAAKLQDWSTAGEAVERFFEMHEPTAEALLIKAKAGFNQGKIEEAQGVAEMLFEQGYTSIELNEFLYELYFSKGEFLKSLDQINLALEKKPGDAEYQFWRAKNYLQINDTSSALDNMRAAFNNGYRSIEAWTGYLDLLNNIGREEEAISMAENAIKKFPENTELRLIYVDMLIKKNQYAIAENILHDLINQQKSLSRSYTCLGRIKRAEHRYDSAIYYTNRAIDENPSHLPAYYLKAAIYRMLGRFQRALGVYREILNMKPDDPIALKESENLRNYLSYLQRKKEEQEQEEFEDRQQVPVLERKSIQN